MKLLLSIVLFVMFCSYSAEGQQQYGTIRKQATQEAYRLLQQGKYQQAITVFERLKQSAFQASDTTTIIRAYYEIGSAYCYLEKFTLSARELRASWLWSKYKRQVSAGELVKLCIALSNSYTETHQRDSSRFFALKAYQVLNTSASVKKQLGQTLVAMFINQASTEIDDKNFDTALNYLNKAQELINGDLFSQSIITSYYASIFQKTKRFAKADSCHQLSIKTYPRQDSYLVWLNLLAANTYLLSSQNLKAKVQIDQANRVYLQLPIAEQGSDMERSIYLRYGQFYARQRQDSTAVAALMRSISISAKQYGPRGSVPAEAYKELAQLYQRKGQIAQALGAAQQALIAASTTFASKSIEQNPDAQDFQLGVPLMEALYLKASLLRLTRPELALKTYRRCLEVALAARREISSQESRLFFQQHRVDEVFSEAISLAFAQRNGELAFWLIEQSRAATLHDRLSEQALKPRHIPKTVLSQEADLQSKITQLKMELTQAPNPQKESQLREVYLALEQLGLRWAQEYPEYFVERGATTGLSLSEVQQKLSADMAYVAWHVASKQLFTVVSTREGATLLVKPIEQRVFDQQIAILRKNLDHNPKVGAYAGSQASQWLYNTLLRPIEANLEGKKRLVVSCNGRLNLVPVDVLEYAPGHYCVERYALSRAYNASIHFVSHVPKWSFSKPALLVFAPFARASGQQVGRNGDTLGPLPATLQECKKLNGTMFINQNAQKVDFLETHRQKSSQSESVIYHFATHSVGNDTKPEESFVAFHPSQKTEYRLYSAEIKQLDFSNVRLAVLNSCSSAYGQLLENEGVLSLARAFTEAGCRAVAAALWTQDDATGSAISVSFHQYLAEGLPADVSLQKAKLDYLNHPPDDAFRDMRHPYFWGAMVVSGHIEAVYDTTRVQWYAFAGGVAVLVLFLGWWIRKRKR